MSNPIALRHLEVYGYFRKNLGPRSQSAGLRMQFSDNRTTPNVHFKVAVSEEYKGAIVKGIKDGMSLRFPDFLETGSVWITEATEHPVDSSCWAFYWAARCAIESAYTLSQVKYDESLLVNKA